jgi:hypothetical protein
MGNNLSLNNCLENETTKSSLISNANAAAGDKQCEVVLVGCGAPKRGMGWYHAVQMMKGKCPSARLCYIVEPWFLGAGRSNLVLAGVGT